MIAVSLTLNIDAVYFATDRLMDLAHVVGAMSVLAVFAGVYNVLNLAAILLLRGHWLGIDVRHPATQTRIAQFD